MSFNKLTPAQAERLALLAEECGEVVQSVAKILRHGYDSCHPDAENADDDNRLSLEKELGDVVAAMKLLANADDIYEERVIVFSVEKLARVGKYLHHSKVSP